jgi:hypothetical protein
MSSGSVRALPPPRSHTGVSQAAPKSRRWRDRRGTRANCRHSERARADRGRAFLELEWTNCARGGAFAPLARRSRESRRDACCALGRVGRAVVATDPRVPRAGHCISVTRARWRRACRRARRLGGACEVGRVQAASRPTIDLARPLGGVGLLLMPSAFASAGLASTVDTAAASVTLCYPARGKGAIWFRPPSDPPAGLPSLIGGHPD